jgi:nucleotide-binding universal stress UspA family protein
MYKKILVPLDGSELSESVLEHVIMIAKSCRIPEVILLRVRKPLDNKVKFALNPEIANELDQAYYDEFANYLEGIAKKLEKKGIFAKTEVLAGRPAEEILKYSHNKNIDLIIMSTHGRSGFSSMVFGSEANKIIRQTKIPVLLKPAH